MGAEAVRELISALDMDKLAADMRKEISYYCWSEAQEGNEAIKGCRGVSQVKHFTRVDDPDGLTCLTT